MSEVFEGYLYRDWEDGQDVLQLMSKPNLQFWWSRENKPHQREEMVSELAKYEGKRIRVTISEMDGDYKQTDGRSEV